MEKNHFSQTQSSKNVKSFGLLPDGKEVLYYTLSNKNGFEFSVITYGATITSLKIPLETKKIDVVLGFETLENYINSYTLPSAPYFGAAVGRFAGRINNAVFTLNGKKNFLNKNHGEHNLHGGFLGFGQKLWKVIKTTSDSITLKYVSLNNEENFPGELSIQVTYALTDKNELQVNYSAIATEDTIVNITQHSYFNLDGHLDDCTKQKLTLNSNKILETNDQLIPTGNYIDLTNHPLDFATLRPCPSSIDHTFVLTNENAAVLVSEKNGIKMTVSTNQPAIHVYVGGNCFNQIKGKENADYHSKSGICFETQNFPDAPNHANFPNSILKKGERYKHQTTFKFENI